MYCRTCGNKMNDNAAACDKCGAKRFSGSYYCQSCGVQTKQSQRACQICGSALRQSLAVSKASKKAKARKNKAGTILYVLGWCLLALGLFLVFAAEGAGTSACAIFGGLFIGIGKNMRNKK